MVVACLALACSLSGVAWASSLPRNSVGRAQLRNNAVNSAKVANHSLERVDLAAGVLPPAMTGDLPSHVTLRGSFFFGHSDLSASYPGPVSGSFDFGGFRLSAPPLVHVIDTGQASTTACPGTVVAPEAAPGAFCIYVSDRQGATMLTVLQPGDETFTHGIDFNFGTETETPKAGGGDVSRVGAHALVDATGSTNVVGVRGTWAVTAP
jgi:hypothetical protein